MKSVLVSVALGSATIVGAFLLAVTQWASDAGEAMVFPGAALSSLAWPEGLHSDSPLPFLVSMYAVNLALYSACWYALMRVAMVIKRKARL